MNRDNKIKSYFLELWNNFYDWFKDKEHPRSRLNKTVFFHDLLKFVGFLLVFLIIYSNVDKFNNIKLIFIKLGSALLLVVLFFLLRKAYHLFKNLKYCVRGWSNGVKAIVAIILILLVILAFVNQEKVVDSTMETYDKINFSKLNPISMNVSLGNFSWSGFKIPSSIRCQGDFDEDIRKAKIKDENLRVRTIEKKSFTNVNNATAYIREWDVDNSDSTINYIQNNPSSREESIDLILARYDFRYCIFGECLDYSELKFSICDGEEAMHPKGNMFGDFFGGLFG
jgi:hypothetical protein